MVRLKVWHVSRLITLRIPWEKVHWVNSAFLIGTFLTAITAAPLYIWYFGVSWFQLAMFIFFFYATGMSITLGYHRLFSHLTFKAAWPVKVFTLLFGAAAFESSALTWCADHRRHHKFVDDHDDDPYSISKGFFHAHIGWLLFRMTPETPLTWVRDLQQDKMIRFQHEHYVPIAIAMGFGLPTLIGWAVGGWQSALGAFLLSGVVRTVFVHHMTFCINSLCHWIGRQPYSSRCSARDSVLMAIFTFGEGYHNFHHEFQHDYRNGVKPWQLDPTKWAIWAMSKIGLTKGLRTVPAEKILKAEIAEQQRHLAETVAKAETPLSESVSVMIHSAQERLNEAIAGWEHCREQYQQAASRSMEVSRERMKELKREFNEAADSLKEAIAEWRATHRLVIQSYA